MEICKTLIQWEEHKQRKNEYYSKRYVASGIACPQCGVELLVDKWVILTSCPPQQSYHCEMCKWHGTA